MWPKPYAPCETRTFEINLTENFYKSSSNLKFTAHNTGIINNNQWKYYGYNVIYSYLLR